MNWFQSFDSSYGTDNEANDQDRADDQVPPVTRLP